MANSRKKISELPALSVASLDTTFVLGISGSTTYKISINNLTSSLDGAFATDLVTNALSSSLDTKLSTSSFNSYTASVTTSVNINTGSLVTTSSFNSYTASISTASLVTSISNLNTFTASVTTASIVTSISNLNTFTASVSTASLVTSISNLNTFTASQSTSSLVNRLNAIESVSASWITESETGSFLTSLSGAISSSSQLTSSYDTRYTLSGSILSSFSQSVDSRLDNLENEISSSVSYAYVTYITEPEVPNNDANGFLKPDGNVSGSISYDQSTGYFTLLAGKTYKLKAVVNTTGGGGSFSPDWDLQWKDVTNNNFIGKQSIYAADGEAFAIITPNTNIQVGLRSLSNPENGHPYIVKNSTFFFIEEMALGIVQGITGSTDYTQIINKPTLISGSSQLTSSFDLRYLVTGSVTSSINALNTATSSYEIKGRGIWSGSAQLPTGIVSGSAQTILNLPTGVVSGSTQLTTAFPSKTTGAWSAPAGASTQSFTVEAGASYTMWVNGNIPNGIITWNATVTTSNTNVPVVGAQYGWYYTPGNALVLTTIPDQIIGTNGSIANTPTSYAPNTSNVFKFGITNNSGTTQTINYGYIKLS